MTVYELRKALEGYAPGAEVWYESDEYIHPVLSVYKTKDGTVNLSIDEPRDERESNP